MLVLRLFFFISQIYIVLIRVFVCWFGSLHSPRSICTKCTKKKAYTRGKKYLSCHVIWIWLKNNDSYMLHAVFQDLFVVSGWILCCVSFRVPAERCNAWLFFSLSNFSDDMTVFVPDCVSLDSFMILTGNFLRLNFVLNRFLFYIRKNECWSWPLRYWVIFIFVSDEIIKKKIQILVSPRN